MPPVVAVEPFVRGDARDGLRQFDFHLKPLTVKGGSEDFVVVASGKLNSSDPIYIADISSFLGVMPSDIVEMAVDVIRDDGLVLYTRSIHKECAGIYDAWHEKRGIAVYAKDLTVTFTIRVNDLNRDRQLQAFFEGLVRITVLEDA